MVLVQTRNSELSSAPDAGRTDLDGFSGVRMDRRGALAALAATALIATANQAEGEEQQEGARARGLGAPARAADLTIGGLAVRLDRDVAARDIRPHFVERNGEALLRAHHPRTNELQEFPFTKETSHVVAYRMGGDIRLAIVDKPKADGSSLVTEAVIEPDGKCYVQANELKGNFKVEFGRGMDAGKLAALGVHFRPEVGRVSSALTSLGMNQETDRVRFEASNDSVRITIFDRAGADGRVPQPEVFVLKGEQLVKLDVPPRQEAEDLDQGPRPNNNADLRDFSRPNVTKVFNEGFDAANRYAQRRGYELSYSGTGIIARGIGAPRQVNPIEIQEVRALNKVTGKTESIGGILPEKEHLTLLHSPTEIRDQVTKMLDHHIRTSTSK